MNHYFRQTLLSLLIVCPFLAKSEEPEKKNHRLYFEWGWNRDWYSKSTISFHGPTNDGLPYDFVVHDVVGVDEFRGDRLVSAPFVPQYSYRIGYVFNAAKGLGIEFNFDHSKYVVKKGQTAHAEGSINEQFFNTDTVLNEPFLLFEHTNGANFTMVNFVKEKTVYTSANKKFSLVHTMKIGGGIVVPKTYIMLDGQVLDNEFHIAGGIVGVETGIKAMVKDHFYLNLAAKACYADYSNALGLGNGKVSHHFFAYEALFTFGYQFSL
jgi:hypothetical protein